MTSPHAQVVQLLRDANCCEDDAARDLIARAILDAAFDAAMHAACNAKLPENFLWGQNARASFDFGKARAVAAIDALKSPAPIPSTQEAVTANADEWITVRAKRALYIDQGKTTVACDRLPSPVTLVIQLDGPAPITRGPETAGDNG
jgi:hypothetical protein